jgi:hypothetical protein
MEPILVTHMFLDIDLYRLGLPPRVADFDFVFKPRHPYPRFDVSALVGYAHFHCLVGYELAVLMVQSMCFLAVRSSFRAVLLTAVREFLA